MLILAPIDADRRTRWDDGLDYELMASEVNHVSELTEHKAHVEPQALVPERVPRVTSLAVAAEGGKSMVSAGGSYSSENALASIRRSTILYGRESCPWATRQGSH